MFLSDLEGRPDPREFRTSILPRVLVCGLVVVSAFAILVAASNPDVTRVLVDNAKLSMGGGATRDQSVTPRISVAVNESALRSAAPSREDIVSAYHTALQSEAPAARNEVTARAKTLDAETLAALMTRAKSLLALGDIAAARLLLERAANSQDATAAFLLAQTYDPAALGAQAGRSVAPDPAIAREWYRKAASLGSADAQKRLTQPQN